MFHRLPQYQSFGAGSTMAAYVAQTKEKLRDSTSNKNPNYPEGVKDTEVSTIKYSRIRYILAESFYCVNYGS